MDEQDNSQGELSPERRTYGCIKCGSPISTYPPDDVHYVASRERSSFLNAIEATYVCSKCNEVTRLYWGRPVLYRGIIVTLRQTYHGIGQIIGGIIRRVPLKRGAAKDETKENEPPEAPPMDMEAPEDLENRIYDYILENGGAIALGRASEDLGIPPELITQAIEKMTLDGRLKQTQENVIA